MFIIILTLVGTLLHLYLFWHLAMLPGLRRGRAFRNLWLIALVLWLLYAVGSFYGHDSAGGLAAWLERLAMDWLGVLFIGSVVMLAVDLLSLLLYRCRPCLSRLRSAGLLLSVVMIGVALVQGARAPVLVKHDVAMPGLPPQLDGTTVAVLADLHLGSQLGAKWLAARVAQVQAHKPDLIVLLGDNFEAHGEPAPTLLPILKRLQAPLGVFAVTGNHEHFGDSSAAIRLTEQAGVQWLRDRQLQLRPGLNLAGVDDLTIRWRRGQTKDFIAPVLATAAPGATILLSHSPLQLEQAAAAGAELMLSGHTHAGQIWPFGYLVQQFYPYLVGRYEIAGMDLIISRGTGLWGPRMRLWQRGEILLLTLRAR
jgi:predicted MPP superfamily phosphohydrolase